MRSHYEPSPVLIRALPPDTSASLLQDKNSLLSSSLVGLQEVQWFPASLDFRQQWRHEEKKLVRRWICNNHRRDLYCNMAGPKKRVHLWNTSKCSQPFSPGERDTTTWRRHFLSAKVLIKIRVKVLPKDCSSLYRRSSIHPNNLTNAAHWTEQISFHVNDNYLLNPAISLPQTKTEEILKVNPAHFVCLSNNHSWQR